MSEGRLILAVPSKGRLMERTEALFAKGGLAIERAGNARGYRGVMPALPQVEVAFLSASEIAYYLKSGRAHLGVTGEDLVREHITHAEDHVDRLARLGFGRADVIVAAPECWIDVARMADLEEIAVVFRRAHGRRLRVATKYRNLTRRFFAEHGVTSYRIVESLGATEGTPAAGMAELIVDITTTGATLKANHLRVLDDGIILKSEANLFASRAADWSASASEARNEIVSRLESVL